MRSAPPPDRDDLPFRVLPNTGAFVPGVILAGRYRIVARVGRGGMGEVFRAEDLRLGQPVALKFLPAELEQDDIARERLLAEVRLARTIAHPNVCRVHDIGDLPAEGDTPARTFLSMEYIDGEDLGSLLRRIGRLPPAKALDIARQLCAGLAAAHDKGVLHRDLKPANVMIDGRGQVRIADFGIAVEASIDASADGSDGSHSGDNAGTLAYMAPERFAGDPATVRSDLYALGLILYETVTGSSPFTVSSPREWVSVHSLSAPTHPSMIVSDVDPAVERAILRCLEKDPVKRPASAAQVAAALPGGDPLAAALAAGETPSPELVAASGLEGTLPRVKAWAWFATAVLALAVAVWSMSSVLFINHTPMPLDTGSLERRAREIVASLGYVTPPADWVSRWRGRTLKAQQLSFDYRQSPGQLLEPLGLDPMNLVSRYPEDLHLRLDARGRLRNLDVGGAYDYSDTTGARSPDWAPLLAAIGADTPPVPSAARRWPSAYLSDTRAAWTATIDGVPSEIEAGALRGRPVSLRIRPAGAPDEHPVPPALRTPWFSYVVQCLLILVPVLLLVLARRNVRLGRGDRRGATRLAVFTFATFSLYFLVDRHWNPGIGPLVIGAVLSLLFPLFWACTVWFAYVAIEPVLRRRWPYLLISWARLMDGRLRDGFVGQAILAGVIAGALMATRIAGRNAVERASHLSDYFYESSWSHAAVPFTVFGEALANGALYVGILVVARMALRRDWAAWCALATFSLLSFIPVQAGGSLWLHLASAAFATTLLLTVLHRFGLLALVIAFVGWFNLERAPLTLDPSRWYFWRGAPAVAIVLALAIWGFMNVLGKQSLVPADAMDG